MIAEGIVLDIKIQSHPFLGATVHKEYCAMFLTRMSNTLPVLYRIGIESQRAGRGIIAAVLNKGFTPLRGIFTRARILPGIKM